MLRRVLPLRIDSAQGATIREGKLLNGAQTVDDLKAWVNSLNI